MNETTEQIMRQLNQKKTHAITHEVGGGDEIDATKLKNISNVVAKTISDPITGSMMVPGTVGAEQIDPDLITHVDNVAVQMEFDRVDDDIAALEAEIVKLNNLNRTAETIISRHRNVYSKLKSGSVLKGFAAGDSICQGVGASVSSTQWHKVLGTSLNAHFGSSDWTPTNNGIGGTVVCNILNHVSYDILYTSGYNGIQKNYPYTGYDYWIFSTARNDINRLSIQDFEYLYRIAVRMGKRNGIDVICIVEPPKLDMATGNIVDGVENSYPDYIDVVRKIAATEGCSIVDLYKEWTYRKTIDNIDLRTYTSDGTHLNDAGQQIMASMIYNCLLSTPSENGEITQNNEYLEYGYVANQIFTPSGGTYTNFDFAEASPFAKYWHIGDVNSLKITAGNFVDFKVPNVKINAMIVTLMRNITQGTITISSPYNVNLISGQTVSGGANQEDSIFYKPTRTDFPAADTIRITASGGDVHLMGITLITPFEVAEHTLVNGTESGSFTTSAISSINFRLSSTVGDSITIDWFGTNIAINVGTGPVMGKITIQTDGGTAKVVDTYTTGYDAFRIQADPFSLPAGWHRTVITNTDKNPASGGNQMFIGRIKIYSLLSKNLVAQAGSNINVKLNTPYNHIRSSIPYTITNKVLTASANGVIETAMI